MSLPCCPCVSPVNKTLLSSAVSSQSCGRLVISIRDMHLNMQPPSGRSRPWGSSTGAAGPASAAVIDVEALADQEALARLHRLSAAAPAEAAPAPAGPPPEVPPPASSPASWETMELPAAIQAAYHAAGEEHSNVWWAAFCGIRWGCGSNP